MIFSDRAELFILMPCEKVIAPYHNTLLACEFMIQRLQTKISETENFYLRLLSVKCQNWETFCSQFLRLTPPPSLSKHSPLPLEEREREGEMYTTRLRW